MAIRFLGAEGFKPEDYPKAKAVWEVMRKVRGALSKWDWKPFKDDDGVEHPAGQRIALVDKAIAPLSVRKRLLAFLAEVDELDEPADQEMLTELDGLIASMKGRPAQPVAAAPPMLTEPLTKVELARYFVCHRNQVDRQVLARYHNKKDGRRYRLQVQDMPPEYRAKRGLT
jgi:hypothetical protein